MSRASPGPLTLTPIREADKETLRKLADFHGWSLTTAVGRAVRKFAELEQIDAATDAPASARKNPDLSKDREPVGV